MPSFDIVSELNLHEVENAINIAKKELINRFDFKGTQSEIQFDKKSITLLTDDESRMKQLNELLISKLIKRGVSSLCMEEGKTEPAGGRMLRQKITLKDGIDHDNSKKITKMIKDSKLKVTTQYMDECVRVTSKKIDDLQAVMALLKSSGMDLPLQFKNMRS